MFTNRTNILVLSCWLWILKAIEPITHIRLFFRINKHSLYCGIMYDLHTYVLWCAPKDVLWLSVTLNHHTWDIYHGSNQEALLIYAVLGTMGLTFLMGCTIALFILLH